MTFSYGGDPSAGGTDELRFLLGDTSDPGLLQDEDLNYLNNRLSAVFSDPLMVAAFCAEAIAGKYAGEVSITADGTTYSGDQLQDKYMKLAAQLRTQYATLMGVGAAPYAGGSEILDLTQLGTRPLNFGIGLDDNPRAGDQRFHRHPAHDAGDPGDYMW